jgi:hypothetical protein
MKCHFCNSKALPGDFIIIVVPLIACKRCLKEWQDNPDLIYTRLAKEYGQGLGR